MDETSEPLGYVQEHIQEVKHLFEQATVKAIKKAYPQNAAGPSGLRYSHIQAALCDELVEEIAEFEDSAPNILDVAIKRQSVRVRGKARPVACGDVLRRVIGAVREIANYFQPWGQYIVAVSDWVETMVGSRRGLHYPLVRWSQRLQQHPALA